MNKLKRVIQLILFLPFFSGIYLLFLYSYSGLCYTITNFGGMQAMQVHVYESPAQTAKAAASLFAARLLSKPDSILGLATGSTPIDTYNLLIKYHQDGMLDFSKARSFNLDEYAGLSPDHPCSYRRFMDEHLFNHINMDETHVPLGSAEDLQAEGRRYDELIDQAGGIDIQLLGLGQNGHIGFNEPASSFSYATQVVELTQSTIEANQRFFERKEDVPTHAISLGIGGIMKAKQIVLIAFGDNKAQAVRAMVKGPVDPMCPASILQLHPDAVILLDKQAASLL